MARGCSVRQLLADTDARELSEWIAYYQVEPFGEERADLRNGIVAATIFNVNRGKRDQAREPKDFMPRFGPGQQERQSAEQMEAVLRAATLRAGGTVTNGRVSSDNRA